MKSRTVIFALLLCSPLSFAAPTAGKKIKDITPAQLNFHYENFDGDFNLPCKAEFTSQNSPYDFTVSCFEKQVLKRKFDVHLALTLYRSPRAPKTRIEILYWVNHDGATSWLTFDDAVTMQEFESSQSLKNESNALRMKVDLRNTALRFRQK